MLKKAHLQTCRFIPISDLVPEEWSVWFYAAISDNAPFTWGDNNRSMVTASRLLEHVGGVVEDDESGLIADEGVSKEAIAEFLKLLESLGETYVDLEN